MNALQHVKENKVYVAIFVLFHMWSYIRYINREVECNNTNIITQVMPGPYSIGNTLMWKSTYQYCNGAYEKEIRYFDKTILEVHQEPSLLTLYRTVFGLSESDWFWTRFVVEGILIAIITFSYNLYQDGITLGVLLMVIKEIIRNLPQKIIPKEKEVMKKM